MRFLHTGDWHLGRTIRTRSRSSEFEAAVDQVVSIAIDEHVDAVLISGDIYDQRSVSAESDGVFFDALLRLHAQGIRAVVIPGNHDSAIRLGALGKLLAAIDVSVVDRVRPPEEGGMIRIPARDGNEHAVVACIPFVPERRFADAAELFRDPASTYGSYDEKMGEVFVAMARAFDPDAVNIVMGHLFLDGAIAAGSEREITIGRAYAVAPARVPDTASYVALGHIHKPQQVSASPSPTYYSGSLIQLDFGETGQDKSVYVVEATARKPARVRAVPIDAGRRLVDLPEATIDDLPRLAAEVGDAYVRAFIRTEGPVPGIADQVRDILPNALDVHLVYERTESLGEQPSLQSLSPRDQFLSYYRSRHAAEPAEGLMDAFDTVYEEVTA